MPIRAACQCGKAFAAPDNLAGKTVKCPQCGQPLRIPAPRQPAAAAPAAAPAPTPQTGAIASLLDEAGIEHHAGPRCPKCDSPMAMNAVVCLKCGFNRQLGVHTQSEVRSGFKEVGHGEAASVLMARAAAEVAAAPVHTEDKDMGGVKSVWTWIFVLFLPLLFGIGFAAAITWGGSLGIPFKLLYDAIMSDHYLLILPAIILAAGLLLVAFGWLAVTGTALERNVWHGLLSMILLPVYCYFWGMANWRIARSQMQTYLAGMWTVIFAGFTFWACVAIDTGNYLLALPILLMFAGSLVNFLGITVVTLIAFEESLMQGMLALLVPLYAPIYGFMRWAKCKRDMIMFLIGFGVNVLGGFLLVLFVFALHLTKSPNVVEFMREASARSASQVRPDDQPAPAPRLERNPTPSV